MGEEKQERKRLMDLTAYGFKTLLPYESPVNINPFSENKIGALNRFLCSNS